MAKDKSVQIVVSAEVKKVIDAFDSAAKGITRFGHETEQIGKAIDGIFSPLMKSLTVAVGAITTGMGALTKAALSVGGEFEHTMTRVAGVSRATSEELELLSAKARELGERLPISATQTAEGMYSLAQAGMSASESLAAIEGVAGLAIAQNYGMAQSADLVVSTLRGFGLEADQSGRVVDVFNNVISSSMLSMDKLAYSMKDVAPVAKSLGISLEEAAAMMGKLADAGMQGSQIGISLKNMMLSLTKPTREAAQALERLGVTIVDASGNMRPMEAILQDLKDANMTAADATTIFGKRAAASALILAESAKDLKQYTEEVGKLGRTQELLAQQMETFKNKVEAVRSAYQEGLLIVFDQIQEKSKGVVDTIRDMILAFNEWAKETKIFEQVMNALFEGFGLATGNIDLFRKALESIDVNVIVAQFKGFAEGVRALFDAFARLANMVPWRFLAEHLDKIAQIIFVGWAVGKITLLVSALTQLGAGFLMLGKHLAAVSAMKLSAITGDIAGLTGTAKGVTTLATSFEMLSVKLGLVVAAFAALQLAVKAAAKVWEWWMKSTEAKEAEQAAERMEQIARDYTEAIKGNAKAMDALPPKYREMAAANIDAQKAQEALSKALLGTGDAAREMTYEILQSTDETGNKIARLADVWRDSIKGSFRLAGKAGVESFLSMFDKLPEDMREVMGKVVDSVLSGMEDVQGAVAESSQKSFIESVSEGVQKALDEYREYAAEMAAKTEELIEATGINAREAWDALERDLLAKAKETSDGLAKEFKNPAVAQAFAQAFGDMAKAAGDGMTLRISDSLKDVKSSISEISKEARTAIDGFLKDMEDLGPAFQNLQLKQVRETTDSIVFTADNGMSKVVQVYDKATGEIKSVSQTIADSGKTTSSAFEMAAQDIENAGRRTGTAWTEGAVRPLEQTGEAANGAAQSIVKLGDGVQSVGEHVKGIATAIADAMKDLEHGITAAVNALTEGFKTAGEEIGEILREKIISTLQNAIPSFAAVAESAGQAMGASMGYAMENAMQASFQRINQAIDAMARRAAAAAKAGSGGGGEGGGGGVDVAALAAAYAREG